MGTTVSQLSSADPDPDAIPFARQLSVFLYAARRARLSHTKSPLITRYGNGRRRSPDKKNEKKQYVALQCSSTVLVAVAVPFKQNRTFKFAVPS